MDTETFEVLLGIVGLLVGIPLLVYGIYLTVKKNDKSVYFIILGGVGVIAGVTGVIMRMI